MFGQNLQQRDEIFLIFFGLCLLMYQFSLVSADATESATPSISIIPSVPAASASALPVGITSADLNKIIIGSVFGSGGVTAIILGFIAYCLKDCWKRKDNINVRLETKRFHKKILDELRLDYTKYSSFTEENSDGKFFAALIDEVLLSFRSKENKKSLQVLIDDDRFYEVHGSVYAEKIARALRSVFSGAVGTDWSRRRKQLDAARLRDKETSKRLIEGCKNELVENKGLLEFFPMFKIQTQISTVYQNQYAELSHLFREDRRKYPIKNCFINLCIIQSTEQRKRETAISQANTPLKDFAELMDEHRHFNALVDASTTEIITPDQIVKKYHEAKDGDEPMRVIALGAPGIGKSTLCQKIAYQSIEVGQSWFPGMLILWIPLREWHNKKDAEGKNIPIFQFIQQRYGLKENPEVQLKENKEYILWLLDGYDEVATERKDNRILDNDLNYVFANGHYFLTSRPAHTESIRANLEVSIVGLVDKDIEAYINSYFVPEKQTISVDVLDAGTSTGFVADASPPEVDKAEELIAFIDNQPMLQRLAEIPLLLDLICFLFDTGHLSNDLHCMSLLYERMIFTLSVRHLRKNLSEHEFNDLSNEDIKNRCKVIQAFLEALAFHGLEKNQIIIKPEVIERAREEAQATQTSQFYPRLALTDFGVMRAIISQEVRITAKEHYFIHLSFQEYYAACYLANKIKSLLGESPEISKENPIALFIQKYKSKKGMALVLSFVAGILSQEGGSGKALRVYFKFLFGGPEHISDFNEPLLLACLKEAKADARIEGIEQYQKNILYKMLFYRYFNDDDYSPLPIQAFSPAVIKSFEAEMGISKQSGHTTWNKWLEIKFTLSDIDALGELISNKVSLSPENQIILRLINKAQVNKVLEKLMELFSEFDDEVKKAALVALSDLKLIEAQTEQVLEKLLVLIKEGNYEVIIDVVFALSKLKLIEAQTEKMLEKLIVLTEEGNEEVKSAALYALNHLKLTEAQTEKALKKLLVLTERANDAVKRAAVFALDNFKLTEAQTEQVLEKLLVLIKEGNDRVKSAAVFALGKLKLTEAQTKQVLEWLLVLTEGGHDEVKSAAVDALSKLKLTEAQTEKALKKLLVLTEEGHDEVKSAVVDALSNFKLTKAQTEKVVEKLLVLIKEGNYEVKGTAVFVFSNLNLTDAQAEKLLEKLLVQTVEGNDEVKRAAVDVLRKLKLTEAQTEKVVEKLLVLIEGGHEEVKRALVFAEVFALSMLKLAEAQTEKVVEKLLVLIKEGNCEVKRTALFVLSKLKLTEAQAEKMLEKLLVLTVEGNDEVKRAAVDVLRKLKLTEGQTEQVLEKLLLLIKEGNDEVKIDVVDVLLKLKLTEAQTEQVLEKLLLLIKEGDDRVKSAALYALNNLKRTEAQKKIVTSLLISERCHPKFITVVSNESVNVANDSHRASVRVSTIFAEAGAANNIIDDVSVAVPDGMAVASTNPSSVIHATVRVAITDTSNAAGTGLSFSRN